MNETIMIVDDSESMRVFLTSILNNAGYQVLTARDGLEALDKLNDGVSVVFTDLTMPNMDGLELIKAIRAIPSLTSLPIIVVSTETGEAIKNEAKKAGATGWIIKPFAASQLLAAIETVLQ